MRDWFSKIKVFLKQDWKDLKYFLSLVFGVAHEMFSNLKSKALFSFKQKTVNFFIRGLVNDFIQSMVDQRELRRELNFVHRQVLIAHKELADLKNEVNECRKNIGLECRHEEASHDQQL